jgi:hypothetical protein
MIAGIDAIYVHGNNSIGAPLTVSGTPYQENNASLRYISTWSFIPYAGFNGGVAASTTDPSGSIMFNIDNTAAGVAVFRTLGAAIGSAEVCIDDACQVFGTNSATLLGDTSALKRGTVGTQHVVEIRNIGAQTIVEAIQVVSAISPLAVGYYEETEQATAFNLTYNGPWISWVVPGALGGTARLAGGPTATASFQVDPATTDRIVIFHSKFSGWGNFTVCADAAPASCQTVTSSSATTQYGVPEIFTLAQLGIVTPGVRTITITPTSSALVDIEAIQILAAPANLGLCYYE